jgi:GNAT superfamily N-acetyltransferase
MTAAPIDITITKLQMAQRPTTMRPPLPHGHENGRSVLLRARKPALHFYRYLYETVGRAYHWVDRRRMTDEALAAIVQDDEVHIYVLYVDGGPAGYFELDFREPPDAELAYFGLFPNHIGKGLGTFLLGVAIDTAWSRPINRLWVHTNTLDHPRALPNYQRLGFVPFAQEKSTIRPFD